MQCPACDGTRFTESGTCLDCLRGAWHLRFLAIAGQEPVPVRVGPAGTIGAYHTERKVS